MVDYEQKLAQLASQLAELKKGIAQASPQKKKGLRRVLFVYSSHHLKGSSKVSFFYGLKGRKNKAGILKQTSSEFLSKGIILCPIEFLNSLSDFFKSWNCRYRALIIEIEKEVNGKV